MIKENAEVPLYANRVDRLDVNTQRVLSDAVFMKGGHVLCWKIWNCKASVI